MSRGKPFLKSLLSSRRLSGLGLIMAEGEGITMLLTFQPGRGGGWGVGVGVRGGVCCALPPLLQKIFSYFMCMGVLAALVCVHHMHAWCTQRPEASV